ncbi:MAG: type II secretion system F family protein [Kiritimatiellales bacterium]|nr:type II secretion system F family protein [Kiritimatiellales bacterium]MCF7864068.1 type II secretion system F family protein [Kiritimatiellales bacterium]
MGVYSYIAKNKEGKEIRSNIEASTRLEALESLRKKGLTVVDLFGIEHPAAGTAPRKVAAKPATSNQPKVKSSFFSAKVKMGDLAIFCRQLAISVNAGVPLRDALDTIGEELEQPALRLAVKDVVAKLNDGKNFSDAVACHPKIFNVMFCGLIRVAEESGKLPGTLRQLAEYLERTDKLQRRIKAMAAYPMFIGIFFVVVCMIMTLFILPQFTDIFGGFGAKLPIFTTVVFGINNFFVDHIIEIFAGVIILTTVLVVYGRTQSGGYRKDKLKLQTPYAGDLIMKYVLARFCRSLAIMVHSGVPISTAMEICSQATGNRVLERTVLAVRDRILTGHGIADSLAQSGIFPGLVVQMVGVGEDSGQLPEVLEKVADLYEDQVEVSIMTTMALFEPVIICVFGAFVLIIVLAIYMPIFTVSSSVR